MNLFTILFLYSKQTRVSMTNLTKAEKISHYWAKQTATAISWTGALAFLVALFAVGFNIRESMREELDRSHKSRLATFVANALIDQPPDE